MCAVQVQIFASFVNELCPIMKLVKQFERTVT